MSKARITRKEGYRCAPNGHTVVLFEHGAEVEGQVAEWALAAHAASRLFDPRTETKVPKPLETKRKERGSKHGRK